MDSPDAARRFLRANCSAVLEADAVPYPGSYTLDASGRLIMPVPSEATLADEFVLMIPDASFDAMQVLALLDLLDPQHDQACDRYLARFGPPHGKRWTGFRVEAIKWATGVFDANDLDLTNPLAHHEPALLGAINADRDGLARVCAARGITTPEQPVAVGVDPDGVDVRARFLVARLGFETPPDEPIRTADQARQAVAGLLGRPL